MKKLVSLENIKKIYANKHILGNITVSVEENQVVAIRGGNGTGKSTLLRIIAGIDNPSSGKVVYHNEKLKIGYVPERFPKQIRFTPREYLLYIGKMSGASKEFLVNKIDNLLCRFQLDKFKEQQIMELSKGNIQKVGIIQAILQNPNLLILDEPLSGLDYQAQKELVMIIQELKQQGTTIILTHHETDIFTSLVDKKLYLYKGNISETELMEQEPIKLLIVNALEEAFVKKWSELIHVENKESQLNLYVSLKDSDEILSRVLHAGGSVEAVSTVTLNEESMI